MRKPQLERVKNENEEPRHTWLEYMRYRVCEYVFRRHAAPANQKQK